MILPIYGYGHPVLKKVAQDIKPDYVGLEDLIRDMWETMEQAQGVGLAAPQIGKSIRIFVVDSRPLMEKGQEEEGVRQVFINPHKVEEGGEEWPYEEGCLSIPNVRGDVERPEQIRLKYVDENFEAQERLFSGLNARVIQHEYDHLDGVLFTERLKPIRRRLIRRKLDNIRKGKVKVDYKMKFTS